jgi:hypothetical protein
MEDKRFYVGYSFTLQICTCYGADSLLLKRGLVCSAIVTATNIYPNQKQIVSAAALLVTEIFMLCPQLKYNNTLNALLLSFMISMYHNANFHREDGDVSFL